MKIVDDRILLQRFEDLKIGDTFTLNGFLAIKIPLTMYNGYKANSINLKTFQFLIFNDDDMVTPIKTIETILYEICNKLDEHKTN